MTVTTTTCCNAHCAYCYEQGIGQKHISKSEEKNLFDFIRRVGEGRKIDLVWFGGEPLLNPGFMDRLSDKLRRENYHFSSQLVTNGSLITQKIVDEKFKKWNVKQVQVTLDGTRENYARIKNYGPAMEAPLDLVLQNICTVARGKIPVSIRMNISRYNASDILLLAQELDDLFASDPYVSFYPAFLTGTAEPYTEEEKIEFLKKLLARVQHPNKLSVITGFHSAPLTTACIYTDPCSYVVDVDGYIYDCENHIGRLVLSYGTTANKGKRDLRLSYTLRDACKKCAFLPKCLGGCTYSFQHGEDPCVLDKYLLQAYMEDL